MSRSLSDSHHDEDEAEKRGDQLASGVFKLRRLANATKRVLDIVRDDAHAIAHNEDALEAGIKEVQRSVRDSKSASGHGRLAAT